MGKQFLERQLEGIKTGTIIVRFRLNFSFPRQAAVRWSSWREPECQKSTRRNSLSLFFLTEQGCLCLCFKGSFSYSRQEVSYFCWTYYVSFYSQVYLFYHPVQAPSSGPISNLCSSPSLVCSISHYEVASHSDSCKLTGLDWGFETWVVYKASQSELLRVSRWSREGNFSRWVKYIDSNYPQIYWLILFLSDSWLLIDQLIRVLRSCCTLLPYLACMLATVCQSCYTRFPNMNVEIQSASEEVFQSREGRVGSGRRRGKSKLLLGSILFLRERALSWSRVSDKLFIKQWITYSPWS